MPVFQWQLILCVHQMSKGNGATCYSMRSPRGIEFWNLLHMKDQEDVTWNLLHMDINIWAKDQTPVMGKVSTIISIVILVPVCILDLVQVGNVDGEWNSKPTPKTEKASDEFNILGLIKPFYVMRCW